MLQRASVSPLFGRYLGPSTERGKRDLLSLRDLKPDELLLLLDLAARVKARPRAFSHALEGFAGTLIFEKPSLRTRVTFELGLRQLGAQSVHLTPSDIALGHREPVPDVARNLARWVDVLIVRTFGQPVLEEIAGAAEIPVINALSDRFHPCQTIADLLTLREHKGRLAGLSLAFVGDGNNVAHSLICGAAKTGMRLTLATPRRYAPDHEVIRQTAADAWKTGASIRVVHDPAEAVRDADAVYTDVWTSMGQEDQAEQRRKHFAGFQVDSRLMSLARPDAFLLHCLPAHRGEEVTAEVLDSPQSIALDQAENRLPVHKAILLALLGNRSPRLAGESFP